MNVLLSHLAIEPLLYGVLIFLGMLLMYWKLMNGRWFSLFIDIGVFSLVFSLHGGTVTGGLAATIAALLSGIFFPMLFR